MSILSAIAALFRRKPQPTIRPAESRDTPPEILDGWNPPADPEPVKPATSPERLAGIREYIPSWGKEIGDPRFDLLYICFAHQITTKEDGWYVKSVLETDIAEDLTPETVAQARLAAETFPIGPDGHHYCPPGFVIPPAK